MRIFRAAHVSKRFPIGYVISGQSLIHQTHAGVVAGGGVDIKIPFIPVSAEIRFSRVGEYFQYFSNSNQAEFLLGIHF